MSFSGRLPCLDAICKQTFSKESQLLYHIQSFHAHLLPQMMSNTRERVNLTKQREERRRREREEHDNDEIEQSANEKRARKNEQGDEQAARTERGVELTAVNESIALLAPITSASLAMNAASDGGGATGGALGALGASSLHLDAEEETPKRCSICDVPFVKDTPEDLSAISCDHIDPVYGENHCYCHKECVKRIGNMFVYNNASKRDVPFFCPKHQQIVEQNVLGKQFLNQIMQRSREKYSQGAIDSHWSVAPSSVDIEPPVEPESVIEATHANDVDMEPRVGSTHVVLDIERPFDSATYHQRFPNAAMVNLNVDAPRTLHRLARRRSVGSTKRGSGDGGGGDGDRGDESASTASSVSACTASATGTPSASASQKSSRSSSQTLVRTKPIETLRKTLHGDDKLHFDYQAVQGGSILYCKLCGTDLTLADSVSNHRRNKGHQERVERYKSGLMTLTTRGRVDTSVVKGEQRAKRQEIVEVLLSLGIPLATIESDRFRNLLKPGRDGKPLAATRRSYADEIPAVLQRKLQEDVKHMKRGCSIYFDGTTHVAQVLGVTCFYIDDNDQLHRVVLKLDHFNASETGVSLAKYLLDLTEEIQLPKEAVVAFGHDRCGVNLKASRILTTGDLPHFSKTVDMQCFSHCFALCGDALDLDVRDRFINALNGVFQMSSGEPRDVWYEVFGSRWPGKGKIRWYSHAELCRYFAQNYSEARWRQFITGCGANAPGMLNRAVEIFNVSRLTLLIQLAVGVDVGDLLARACYFFERDGLVAHRAWRMVLLVSEKFHNMANGTHHPQLSQVAREYGEPSHVVNGLEAARTEANLAKEGRSYIENALRKFDWLFFHKLPDKSLEVNCYVDMIIYKAAELIDPRVIGKLVDSEIKTRLEAFIPINGRIAVEKLMDELAAYKAEAMNIASQNIRFKDEIEFLSEDTYDVVAFWRINREKMPTWKLLCDLVRLLQTSSASVERLFAALLRLVDESKASALQDYRTLACKGNQDKIIANECDPPSEKD